jgi:hypothetical protein
MSCLLGVWWDCSVPGVSTRVDEQVVLLDPVDPARTVG